MVHITELSAIIQLFFLWNKARCDCLVQIMISLYSTRTVNVSILSEAFVGNAKQESNYKRIIRFLAWLRVNANIQLRLGKLVLEILNVKGKRVHISMDRTCWKFGATNINFLVVAIHHHGVGIPIYFKLLPTRTKNGNSDTEQRISILSHVISLVGVENIICFSADREFIGVQWFGYLQTIGIPFTIRIKENTLVARPQSEHETAVKEICKRVRKGKQKIFKGVFRIWGMDLHLAASRNQKGDLLILASNISSRSIVIYYLKRWSIETLFKYLKTNGFNFEDTHVQTPKKLETMFFALTLVVVWTLKVSHSLKSEFPLKHAAHGRKRVSYFRRGLTAIRSCIHNLVYCLDTFLQYVHLMISNLCTENLLNEIPKRKSRIIQGRMVWRLR